MTEGTRRRGTYAKTAARRREILEAGLEVFSTMGFRSGSIRDIADRVGISQAGLLHHFATKNDLLAAVLDLRDDIARDHFSPEDETGLNRVRGLVRMVEYNASVPGLVELYCVLSAEATTPEHPAHDYFVDRYRWVVGYTRAALEAMKAGGQTPADLDPASAARTIVALMDGLQVQWLLDRGSVDMADELRRYLGCILPGTDLSGAEEPEAGESRAGTEEPEAG